MVDASELPERSAGQSPLAGSPFDGRVYVADKSAWERATHPLISSRWIEAVLGGQLLSTPVVAAEVLYSARDGAEFDEVEEMLGALRTVRLDHSVVTAALRAMRRLAHHSPGYHRLPFADVLVAAAAESRGAGVLHYDRHFDRLARFLSFESRWVAPSGAL